MKKIAFLCVAVFSANVFGMDAKLDANPSMGKRDFANSPVNQKDAQLEENSTQVEEGDTSNEDVEQLSEVIDLQGIDGISQNGQEIASLEGRKDVVELLLIRIGELREQLDRLRSENDFFSKCLNEMHGIYNADEKNIEFVKNQGGEPESSDVDRKAYTETLELLAVNFAEENSLLERQVDVLSNQVQQEEELRIVAQESENVARRTLNVVRRTFDACSKASQDQGNEEYKSLVHKLLRFQGPLYFFMMDMVKRVHELERENKKLIDLTKKLIAEKEVISEQNLSNNTLENEGLKELIAEKEVISEQNLSNNTPKNEWIISLTNKLIAGAEVGLEQDETLYMSDGSTDQSDSDSENSTEIQGEVEKFDSENEQDSEKDSSNENDWGLFFKETNNGEDCLRLKGDSFLIKFKLIKDTFSLSNKGDYVKFGFETWYKLVEFKLTADILGEFS
nr:hypothetical protein [Alphaproteobacteria bacterium]